MPRLANEWTGKSDDSVAPPRVQRPKTCSVNDCGRRHEAHGFCRKHYARFKRHGDPLGGTTERWAAQNFMNNIVLMFTAEECLTWPFGDNSHGYGVYHSAGKTIAAHIYVCAKVHGERPSRDYEAAHSCGNGHLACVNPRHLRWATRSQNQLDRRTHGTVLAGERNPRAKLSEDNVIAIRALCGKRSQREIAIMFGVSQMIISKISRGLLWGHVYG